LTHETEAPPDLATATAEPPITGQRQRLTKPSKQTAVQPSPPAEPAAAAPTTPESTTAGTSIAPGEDDPNRKLSVVSQMMEQGTDETQALLDAVGLRGDLSGEARDIARLIERRLAATAADQHLHPHSPAVDDLQIQRAFLEHRFVGPLRTYERTFRGYSVLDNFLNLTSIAAGLGASLAAALVWPKVWAIAFGLVVGCLQSLSQWLKPSKRSTRRGLAASDLRSEGWAFLQGRDRYKDKSADVAWKLFCDQIDRVEDREQTEQDKESADTATAKGGGKKT
jgi:hypothetical protein